MHSASFEMNQEYAQIQSSNIGQTLQVVGGTNQNNQQIIQLVSPQIGSITIINNDFSQININQSSYKAVKTFKKTAIQKGQMDILKGAPSPLDGHDGLIPTNQTIQVVKNVIKDASTAKRSKMPKNKKKQKDLLLKTKDLIH